MDDSRNDRTSAIPLFVACIIFVGVVAVWFPYMQKGAFQDEVTPPGVNTTPEESEWPSDELDFPDESDEETETDPYDESEPDETPPSLDDDY